MALYEVELRREGKMRELRVGDRPLTIGQTVSILGQPWRVLRVVKAEDERAVARYVCVPTNWRSNNSN